MATLTGKAYDAAQTGACWAQQRALESAILKLEAALKQIGTDRGIDLMNAAKVDINDAQKICRDLCSDNIDAYEGFGR